MYCAQLDLMQQQYLSNKLDPTKVLEVYLTIHTTGEYNSYRSKPFPPEEALLRVSAMKDLASSLGPEFVILWNAMLLRKRILCISDNLEKLLLTIRSFPQLVLHRKDWGILRPIVKADIESIEDLKSSGVYVAGTTDFNMASHSDLYDVMLQLNERKVTIANHAVDDMRMNVAHRELATLVTESLENGGSNEDIIRVISQKTNQIIAQLSSLGGEGLKLSEEVLKERISNESTRQWLLKVAISESLL
jgi:hypothetical protein